MTHILALKRGFHCDSKYLVVIQICLFARCGSKVKVACLLFCYFFVLFVIRIKTTRIYSVLVESLELYPSA